MSIENDLKRIADALEIIAGKQGNGFLAPTEEVIPTENGTVIAPKAKAAKKVESKPVAAVAAVAAVAVTKEMVADVLREVVVSSNPSAGRTILTKYGVTRLSEIKEKDYEACHRDLKEVLSKIPVAA